jgi:anti-anti-sigma factor
VSTLHWAHGLDGGHQPGNPLTIRRIHEGPATVIDVEGEIDADTAPLLIEAADRLTSSVPPLALLMDLSRVTFFCAAGIHALLRVRDITAARSTHLILHDPSPMVGRILMILDMADTFDIKTGIQYP